MNASTAIKTSPDMISLIHRGIEKEIARIVEEEAAEAAKRVEKLVRESAAQIAVLIARRMSVEPYGPDALKIIVEFDPKK